MDLIQKIQFLDIFFQSLEDFNPKFTENFSLILTGGEPFLFPTQVFKIAKFCRVNGVNSYVNSNGTLLRPLIGKILDSGLTGLTISLDSHKDEIHDNLRGIRGIFRKIIDVIKLMLNQKQ